MSHYNTDKKLSELYLARSEGKTIEAVDAVGKWHSVSCEVLHHANRIKPQTVEEAAMDDVSAEAWSSSHKNTYVNGAKFGAQWQKDQDQ